MAKSERYVGLALMVATAGCLAHTREPVPDAGGVDARAGRAGICTTPLSSEDARDARDELARQLREVPRLRELVFRRGPWTLRSVAELEAALLDGVNAEEFTAVTLVGQSFVNCTDAEELRGASRVRTILQDTPFRSSA